MLQDGEVGGDRGRHTFDDEFVERPDRAGDRHVTVASPHDELADEVVVVLADLVAGVVAGVETDTEPVRREQLRDRAGRREEFALGDVLGVDADLDRVAATGGVDLGLRHRQLFAGRDTDLPLDEVDVGDHLADGMLDLESGVHLEEEEVTVLEDELDGAGAVVADRLGSLDRRFAHRLLDTFGQVRCRGFFDELLMATLRRTVTRRDPHAVAVLVADQLDLDMAGPREVALDVHLVAPEERLGLALGAGHCIIDLGLGLHDLHTATAATEGGLDAHRPAELVAEGLDLVGTLCELGGAGNDRGATADRSEAARHLVGHLVHGGRRWADELDAQLGDRPGEFGVLGEEPVAGVHRVGAAALDHFEHDVGVDVALGGGLTTERIRLIGEAHVECLAVEFGIHRHRGDAHLSGGADDSNGDFATIGDQDLLEHGCQCRGRERRRRHLDFDGVARRLGRTSRRRDHQHELRPDRGGSRR